MLERINRLDIRDLLPQIRIPVLLIHGELDVVASPAVGRHLQEHIPAARLEIVPGAGHCPHMTASQRVAALIEEFIGQFGIGVLPASSHPSSFSN